MNNTSGAPTEGVRDDKMDVSQLISSSSKMDAVVTESDGEWEDEQEADDNRCVIAFYFNTALVTVVSF